VRKPSTTPVANVLHHTGKLARPLRRDQKPAFYGLSTITGEGDVKHLERLELSVIGLKLSTERETASFCQSGGPKGVKIGRFLQGGVVFLELVER
jgi:hypothetical protein